ncbi:MAG: 2-C-methyl-D-erythritol 2,4-cyclodiphosphate synthase [Nitrospiraceae bacterium]|nr:MAG: 2-C-methyl-D-erythritol 2,4-cyclodiphosphate synthase [Nitrospiraceae bacterium]
MRVGIGYDIHPLVAGRKLILGGIEVSHAKGLDGHSDADVLTHAVCDALLGAMGEGDLGTHFPASDQRYKDIASLKLLAEVVSMMARKNCRLVNLDTVVNAQAPKLAPHLAAMKDALAKTMGVEPARINLKVKSGEGQGVVGREEAMTAQAVCLIEGI